MSFPSEVAASGYKPVLLVLDPTSNAKLIELTEAFHKAKGDVYLGDEAWNHLEMAAGPIMAQFLDKYVKAPVAELLNAGAEPLLDLTLHAEHGEITFTIGDEKVSVVRHENARLTSEADVVPDDYDSDPVVP